MWVLGCRDHQGSVFSSSTFGQFDLQRSDRAQMSNTPYLFSGSVCFASDLGFQLPFLTFTMVTCQDWCFYNNQEEPPCADGALRSCGQEQQQNKNTQQHRVILCTCHANQSARENNRQWSVFFLLLVFRARTRGRFYSRFPARDLHPST